MVCIRCKKEVEPGNRPDGLPNGIGLIINDRTVVLCTDCVIETGAMNEKSKEWFFKQMKGAGEQDA